MTTNTPNPEPTPVSFREAYDLVLPEMERLAENELVFINVDIPVAVTTVLGAWPEIASYRERLAAAVVPFDAEQFGKIETYALAAGHAHALYMAAATPTGSLEELVKAADASREQLMADVNALVVRGHVPRALLKDLKGPLGHRNLAFDVMTLSAMIRERWTDVQTHTGAKLAELDEAERRAKQLLHAVGLREQAPQVVAASADNRQRAFTLLMNAYDQARRALTFLRWAADDLDEIAPSLYAGRGGTKRKGGGETGETTTPVNPPTAPPVVPARVAPAATPSTEGALPGGSPYTH